MPAALVVTALWMVLVGEDGLLNRHALKQHLIAKEQAVANVETGNQELSRRIRALRTDPDAIRREAARTLLLAETGSTIYRLDEAH